MFKHINFNVLGTAFIVVVLLCAGIYFYMQWDNRRFVSELGTPPPLTTKSKPTAETQSDETQPTEPTEFISENDAVLESESAKESELMDEDAPIAQTDTSEPTSEFDPTPLLSAFGLPEEVTSLLNESADETDFEHAQEHLVQEYGQSPEVKAIIDKLRQMSGGSVKLDDLTELFEAWILVLPEGEQESRRQLMDVLTQLYQAKTFGGNAEMSIEVQVIEMDDSDN